MNPIKPVIIHVSEDSDRHSLLARGCCVDPLSAYIRQQLDCDVLMSESIRLLEYKANGGLIKQMCQEGLVIAIIIQPCRDTIEGNEIEKLYKNLRDNNIETPILVMDRWLLEEPIMEHSEDPFYLNGIQEEKVIEEIEKLRKQFSDRHIILTREQQFILYKRLEVIENILPTSEIVEWYNLSRTPEFISDFNKEAEIIRNMPDEERALFETDLDFVRGLRKNPDGPGYFVLQDRIGMGPNCASFAANSLTKDFYLTNKGQNHAMAEIKMHLLIRRLAELREEIAGKIDFIHCVGGYIYYNVGEFKTPILILNGHESDFEGENSCHRIVSKFIFDIKLALPVWKDRLIE